jgi:lantibiotic biosynthesis dehydratase-like protein
VDTSTVEAHVAEPTSGHELSPHLVSLKDDEWALWRWACLRSAGFPADEMLKLASADCAAAADELLTAEEQARLRRREAVELVLQELARATDDEQYAKINKAARRLQKHKPVEFFDGSQETLDALKQFTAALSRVEESRQKLSESYKVAAQETSRAIQEVCASENFQRAVIWQNRAGFNTGIRPLLRKSPTSTTRDSKYRQKEEFVATYMQRYFLKNDTIGFFGPVGWARFTAEDSPIEVRPGKQLLATSKLYVEDWCLDTLAGLFAENKRLRPWFAPRAAPSMYLEGEELILPGGSRINLSAKHAAVLEACDGQRTAKHIARDLIDDGGPSLRDESEVYAILDWMQKRGMISWTLSVPCVIGAERKLRGMLEAIEDEELRRVVLKQFDEIEGVIAEVARAATDSERLEKGLRQLEEKFTQITGVAATRAAGETYAARTLVYEDCRRDIEVKIGAPILRELSEPLTLILTSARWLTWEVAQLFRGIFKRIYDELVRSMNTPTVDFISLWTLAGGPQILKKELRPINPLIDALRKKWDDLLEIDAEQRHIKYRTDDLRAKVEEAFAAPAAGWKLAAHHSPDVMIVARSVDAIQRDNYQLVLGEIHLGTNTLRNSFFVAQHPAPEDLFQSIAADFPQPRVLPVLPKHWGGTSTSRTTISLVSPKDFWLEVALDSPSSAPRSQTLKMGELVVEESDAGLVVRTRDGRLRFDLIEFLGETLAALVINSLKIESAGRHTPRISFDRLVVARESWRFSASECDFAHVKDEVERFVQARRWAQSHGIPRFAFVRVPVEVKPFYIDFDSPVYVSIMSKMVRRTLESTASVGDEVTVSEMLPGIDMLWLPDEAGRHYTSELRIIALDLKSSRPAAAAPAR